MKTNIITFLLLLIAINPMKAFESSDVLRVEENTSQEKVVELIKAHEKLSAYLIGDIKKVIFVPNKITNFIVK